jgi:hypothetical protein
MTGSWRELHRNKSSIQAACGVRANLPRPSSTALPIGCCAATGRRSQPIHLDEACRAYWSMLNDLHAALAEGERLSSWAGASSYASKVSRPKRGDG